MRVSILCVLLLCAYIPSTAQTITTVAGTATCCSSADGAPATSAWLASIGGMAVDPAGNIYIEAASKIRKVNTSGAISTIAGNGNPAYTGDGGPALSASIFGGKLAVDSAGNVYLSDQQNQVIRKISTSGIITTYAGNGSPGYSGDGGQATKAMLSYPGAIAFDKSDNLYIADGTDRVRKVTPAGIISTYAGNGNVVYSGDGVQATTTAVVGPAGLAFNAAGDLYISEGADSRVRKVTPDGIISTVAGQTKRTRGFSGDGGPATAATLTSPQGLAVDSSGNLYIADTGNSRVRKVDASGIITTIAGIDGNASTPIGDGGPATSAFLGVDSEVDLDPSGNLLILSSAAGVVRVRKITASAGLVAAPASLSLSYGIGGATPAAQTVAISSSGAAASFTATTSASWLTVTPKSGSTPGSLTISVNPAGMAGGTYQGAVTVTPSGGLAPLTFSVTLTVTGAGAPSFTTSGVFNALGYQTTLAPGAVFVVFGSGLGPDSLATASGTSYPNSIGGTSISLTPASGGSPVTARMLYASSGQVAGLLPSSITPGTYAMRVTYNTLTSAPENVTVVARSFGIATANSTGAGTAQATIGNVNGGISLTRFTSGSTSFNGLNWTLTPAHPGDTLVLWGTGGGADPANDSGGTSGDQTAAGNFSVNVNGRAITPLYAGASSGYPGLWQINFTLPADITPDCFASVQVSAGGELSNAVSVPIAPAGQSYCSDPQLSQSALQQLDAGGSVTLGALAIEKISATSSAGTTTSETLTGAFPSYTSSQYAAAFGGMRIGLCTLTDRTASVTAANPAVPGKYLDAGSSLPATGPGLAAGAALGIGSTNPGPIYSLSLGSGSVAGGGTYTVTGKGGAGVGPFTATVHFPNGFSVTNWDALSSINRNSPLTINWTGSGFDSVAILGSTYAYTGKDASNNNIIHNVSFSCTVPAAPGTYTLPTALLSHLLAVPAQSTTAFGFLTVDTQANSPFTAPLTSGGQAAFAVFTAVQGYSRGVTVQ